MTEDPTWLLRIEGYEARSEAGVEAALCVGNGFVGVRGGLEEGPTQSIPRTFIAGLFDRVHTGPRPPTNLDAAPQLVTGPDWLAFDLHVDGEQVHIEAGDCVEQTRVLDLHDGLLCRRLRLRSHSGRETTLIVLRCAHLQDRQALLQQFLVRPENFDGRITLDVVLDGRRMRARDEAPRLQTSVDTALSPAVLVGCTPHGPARLAMAQRTALVQGVGQAVPGARRRLLRRDNEIVHRWVWDARRGETYALDSFVACQRSLDGAVPAREAAQHAQALASRGMPALLTEHKRRWHERWRDGDVQIDGDADAQRAVRWALYQLCSAVDPTDDHVSIGARGLTGLSYHGHAFWDTEICMLPYYTFTWPEAARTLLRYRYRTLPAARAKAAAQGYAGALYAWESALSGAEVTPEHTPGPDGRPVRIYTGEQAHHISADVAYAVRQYVLATGDEEFLLQAGAEILFETARFWASRIEVTADGAAHLRGLIGPDEYHPGVDDEAYTLGMACHNLVSALWAEQRLAAHPQRRQELHERIGLQREELARWRGLAARLAPRRTQDGLIEEFRGYLALQDIDLKRLMSAHPGAPSAQAALGEAEVRGTQIIKQADVVLLTALLEGQFTRDEIARSFAYYEPRCDHASSLSPGPHSLVAARLGLRDAARRYFERAAFLDLSDRCAHAAEGVHLGNCGALWQALVFGVAGMRLCEEGLIFEPQLLPGWSALRFAVRRHGSRLDVEVDGARGELRMTNTGPGAVPVRLREGAWQRAEPRATLRLGLAAALKAKDP